MTTKILGNQITSYTIDTVQLSNTATAAFAKTLAPKVLYANVASNTFTVLDDTAVNVGGGYIVVTGAEFQSGATVLIDTTPASAVTYVNSTTLQVQVPTKSAASYNLYVVNPDGGVGIKVSGITYSSEPSWVTTSPLANQNANTAFGVNLSATGATSYSVAAGSTLPAGTTLAANGYFSGTVSIGAQTTYTFDVVATDAELQDSTKTFQVTVTVTPPGGSLWSWGFNSANGLGDGITRSSPTQVGTGTNWKLIAGSSASVHVIKGDGTLWAWGQNSGGMLGINDIAYRSSPVQVGSGTNWAMIGGDLWTTTAIKTDGSLWSWGAGTATGQNDTTSRSSPTQVGSNTNWSAVFHGKGFGNSIQCSMATKTDGTLWTWGANSIGQLGQGDVISRSSPVQVGSGTDWPLTQNKLTGTSQGMFAIKSDGTLWMWGGISNFSAIAYRSSPTQVGSNTNWSTIAGGWYTVGATKTDGTLWVWGWNSSGIIGNNSTTNQNSPIQIGSSTNWSNVRLGQQHTIATKTDGTLWTWGMNFYGNLGHNNVIYRSSPVQVGASTSWRTEYGAIAAGSTTFATLNTN